MLTNDEKEYLRTLVKFELERFNEEESLPHFGDTIPFLKATHDYRHFLEKVLEKLE